MGCELGPRAKVMFESLVYGPRKEDSITSVTNRERKGFADARDPVSETHVIRVDLLVRMKVALNVLDHCLS